MNTTTTPPSTATRKRILIVEDEAVIAMDMAQQLRDFGYEVVGIAASGERARRLVQDAAPDLVMMDIMIKGGSDGIETARSIRAEHNIPVVFLTAYGDSSTLERAKVASPHGYLVKPFRPQDLRTTIEIALHRQALDDRVRRSEHWLRKTLQCLGDGVIAADAQGDIQLMNTAAESLLGCRLGDVAGRRPLEIMRLYDPDTEAELPDLMVSALLGHEAIAPRRGLLRAGDGTPRLYVDAGAAPIRDDDGTLLGGVLVMRDVTQRRLDEQELLRHREHLEALVRERTRELEAAKLAAERASDERLMFMSTVSHELRTPLNAVLGFSQLLGREILAERPSGYLRHVQVAGSHLLRMVEDVLDLARIDAGRMTVQMQTTDVAATVDKAVPMVMPQAAEHDIRLVVEPPAEPLQVSADPTRLLQVLVNLLSNSIKYNRRGGEVRLVCHRRGGGRVRISVADTGRGIAPDQRERLFRAFERLGAESGDIEGAGIGLAFSHRMAALMGGELGFESEVGRGSTFWIELPEVPSQTLAT